MNKFKIPTLLGLGIILTGIIIGVYLTLKEQTVLSRAGPSLMPENITISNITDDSAVISWQTSSETASFITFGQNNPAGQTVLDDRDTDTPKPHLIHYVTLKNLLPKTTYKFKAVSGKLTSDVKEFQTAQPLVNQTEFPPVIGSVPADPPIIEGVAYLSIPGAVTQSALIKTGGNFLIPLSSLRKDDLSEYQITEKAVAKLTIFTSQGQASALFNPGQPADPLPPIKLGQDVDLTGTPQPTPANQSLLQYDLNNDGKMNAADYALISSCFNKKPSDALPGGVSCFRADIDQNNKINKDDLNLMSQKFKEFDIPTFQ